MVKLVPIRSNLKKKVFFKEKFIFFNLCTKKGRKRQLDKPERKIERREREKEREKKRRIREREREG